MDRNLIDLWIIALLLYIISLLSESIIWLVFAVVAGVMLGLATICDMIDYIITWHKNRKREHTSVV